MQPATTLSIPMLGRAHSQRIHRQLRGYLKTLRCVFADGAGAPIRLMGLELPLAGGQWVLIYGLILAGLGLLSGFCLYFTERSIMNVTRAYEKLNAARILAIAADPTYRGWPDLLERPA